MVVVIDTSVILSVVLNEANKARLIQLTTGAELLAPISLHWQIGNALSALLKRKRIRQEEALQVLIQYQQIPIRLFDVALDETLAIANQYNIYAYEAYFLVCARQHSCALLTLDGGLQAVARAANIRLVEIVP